MSFEDPDVGRHADVCVNVSFCTLRHVGSQTAIRSEFFTYMQQIFGHQTTRVDFYGYPVIRWFKQKCFLC